MQSFIVNSHEVFIHIHQGCFAGTGAIVGLPQCQWSKPDGYGKISQCITTTKHSKAKTECIFLGIYCTFDAHAYPANKHYSLWIAITVNRVSGSFPLSIDGSSNLCNMVCFVDYWTLCSWLCVSRFLTSTLRHDPCIYLNLYVSQYDNTFFY